MSFNKLFELYDQQLLQKFEKQDQLNDKILKHYNSFLENLRNYSRLSNLTFSLLISLILLAMQMAISVIVHDWDAYMEPFANQTWFLSVLIGVTTFIVLSAKYHLKEFTAGLIILSEDNSNEVSERFLKILSEDYIGFNLIWYGLFFGTINLLFGVQFGIAKLESSLTESVFIYMLFFLAGFINGIAIGGVAIVIKMVRSLDFREEIKLDYFYPDKCAGTLKIGNILFIFSLYTIASGLLIFIYLHITDWSNVSEPLTQYLLLGWKLFPFIMAGVLFLYPVFVLNRHLTRYKYKEQLRVRKRLSYINEMIMNLSSDDPKSKEQMALLDEHYVKLERIDQFINDTNTWPYDLGTKTVFISVFLPTVIGVISEISDNLISDLLKEFFSF